MEYANKTTGHVINTHNRVVQLPDVINNRLYVKNRVSESLTAEELTGKGYVPVIQPNNTQGLPLSEVQWYDDGSAYREVVAEELLE